MLVSKQALHSKQFVVQIETSYDLSVQSCLIQDLTYQGMAFVKVNDLSTVQFLLYPIPSNSMKMHAPSFRLKGQKLFGNVPFVTGLLPELTFYVQKKNIRYRNLLQIQLRPFIDSIQLHVTERRCPPQRLIAALAKYLHTFTHST